MPPKRTYDDEDDSDETTDTETSSSEEEQVARPGASGAGGRGIANKPHDEEFDVADEGRRTPEGVRKPAAAAGGNRGPAGPQGTALRNNPNDETFEVDDDRQVTTPPGGGNRGLKQTGNAPPGRTLSNNPHDQYEDVDDGEEVRTPRLAGLAGKATGVAPGPGAGQHIRNDHHDEAIDVSGETGSDASPSQPRQGIQPQVTAGQRQQLQPQGKPSAMRPQDSSSEDEYSQQIGGSGGQSPDKKDSATKQPPKTLEYNPADYASINQRASREMQELFQCITAYQPVVQELPSKLRPFVPDFIPSVGDLDPFCKIPRPDGRPDHLGLHVVDEPCVPQSNPAVVKTYLEATTLCKASAEFVDYVDDAANRPSVIDKWVSDIKQLHYKKPLPTVNYSKPMPEIEALLQVWPQEFEEILNSDIQFPPTQIDLDIEQYVRVMCSILDVPVYGSLVESLHVMFTLYLEFRANQHFQHA